MKFVSISEIFSEMKNFSEIVVRYIESLYPDTDKTEYPEKFQKVYNIAKKFIDENS